MARRDVEVLLPLDLLSDPAPARVAPAGPAPSDWKWEAERRDRELEACRRIADVVADEIDRAGFVEAVAREIAAVFRADVGRVWSVGEGVATLVASVERGTPVARLEGEEPGVDLVGEVVRRRAPIAINDRHDPRLVASDRPAANALLVPIIDAQRRVIGVLDVRGRRDAEPFGPRQIQLLTLLGRQVGVGLARADLYDRMQEWGQSLEMLLAFNAAVNRHLQPHLLVRSLVEHAARFLHAMGGRAGFRIAAGEEIEMVSDGVLQKGRWRDVRSSWRTGEGIPGSLLESEFPYLSNEYPQDRLADRALVALGVGRVLAVPIKTAQLVLIGFFELHRTRHDPPFSWQDAAFIESLANTAAVAIENAQLLGELEVAQERLQALSADHVNRLEHERRHIARELHDVAGQALIGIKLGLQALAMRIGEDVPTLRVELNRLRQQVNESTVQLKTLARHLRPPTLDALGLVVALRQLVSEIEEKSGLAITVHADDADPRLPHEVETALYRIVQEAITNVVRHAEATQIDIRLTYGADRVEVTVSDDGRGFDPARKSTGLGLLGMRERVGILGGRFVVESAPGKGARLRVEVPR